MRDPHAPIGRGERDGRCRPGPSAPTRKATRCGQVSRGRCRRRVARATTSSPARPDDVEARPATGRAGRTGTCRTWPIDTRTGRRPRGSAVSGSSRTASTPNARALRNSEPEVLEVVEPLGDDDPPGTGDDVGGVERRRPLGGGDHARGAARSRRSPAGRRGRRRARARRRAAAAAGRQLLGRHERPTGCAKLDRGERLDAEQALDDDRARCRRPARPAGRGSRRAGDRRGRRRLDHAGSQRRERLGDGRRGARACAAAAGRGWRGRGRRRPTARTRRRAASASPQSTRTWVEVVIVDGSRSISAQRWCRTSSAPRQSSTEAPGWFQWSAKRATDAEGAVRAGAADDDRRVRPLHGLGLAAGLAEREVAAVEVADLLVEQEPDRPRAPSSKRSNRSFSGGRSMPRASDSSWFQPAPRPSSSRPSLTTSRVAAMLASTDGWR